jgi:hypothetical protein
MPVVILGGGTDTEVLPQPHPPPPPHPPQPPGGGVTIDGTAGPDGSIMTLLARLSSSANHPSVIVNVTFVTGTHPTVLDQIDTATIDQTLVYVLVPLANFLHVH